LLLISEKLVNPSNDLYWLWSIDQRAGEGYTEFLAVIIEPLCNPVLRLWSKQLFPLCWQTPATPQLESFPLLIVYRKANTTIYKVSEAVFVCRFSDRRTSYFHSFWEVCVFKTYRMIMFLC